jgi:hypothetical protein
VVPSYFVTPDLIRGPAIYRTPEEEAGPRLKAGVTGRGHHTAGNPSSNLSSVTGKSRTRTPVAL